MASGRGHNPIAPPRHMLLADAHCPLLGYSIICGLGGGGDVGHRAGEVDLDHLRPGREGGHWAGLVVGDP
ncbi:MAG: hypothetical protein OXI96_05775 [Acidimicrobiaceae bacterium]|nr:hypothetical protein [Acidimicrobiaceae bacterium]